MDASGDRAESPCPVGFIGDLDDPWIAGIADRLAKDRPVLRTRCAGQLPDRPFEAGPIPRAIIVHRHTLAAADAQRLEHWRSQADPSVPELVLTISPYVRYEELERWSGLVDSVVSETVAAEVLPGRLARRLDGYERSRPTPGGPLCRVEAGTAELGGAVVEALARAGYATRAGEQLGGGPAPGGRDRSPPSDRTLTIWEAPVLEPDWVRVLESRARGSGPVIALMGFADRAIATRAREAGAVACLELPCDLDDLIDVVDRIVGQAPADSWPIPARAEPPHRLPPARRDVRRPVLAVAPSRWPDGAPAPTIPGRRGAE